jgi:uncharacterized protein with GYD domain
MPVYVTLGKGTADGYKDIRGMSERFQAVCKAVQAGGGRVIGCYATMGQYDYVLVTEMPSEKHLMKTLVQEVSNGTTTLETLTAIPIEEFLNTVKTI